MKHYTLEADEIIEILVGNPGLLGYGCKDSCIELNGYVAMTLDRKNIYAYCKKNFKCPNVGKDGTCRIFEDFMKPDVEVGVKKKRGRKTDMLKEVLETIGGSGIKELRIPIKVNIPEDEDNASKENFSLENIYNFLDIPDMYRTGKCDIEDTGFTMVMKRIEVEEKEKPKLMQVAKDKIKEKISKMKEYFS